MDVWEFMFLGAGGQDPLALQLMWWYLDPQRVMQVCRQCCMRMRALGNNGNVPLKGVCSREGNQRFMAG